jgi:undecaprenyl diphosphate synthase
MAFFASSTASVPQISTVPQHVAIIMDGNGRWATKRLLPRVAGHAKGVEAVRVAVEHCVNHGVKFLTLFAFSSENWRRPPDEVSVLMRLFVTALEREVTKLHANSIRLMVVGDLSAFDEKLRRLIQRSVDKTAANTGLTLSICANYGGRWDITQATRQMLAKNPSLAADPAQISDESLAPYLAMSFAPEPDLFIRTGGEKRISNFLLWQLAYTELFFTDTYWPDFDATCLAEAFASYSDRERRFGRTSDQLSSKGGGKQAEQLTQNSGAQEVNIAGSYTERA